MPEPKLYPWENFPELWPTKAKFMAYMRGGFRKSLWSRNPIKIEFMKGQRYKAPLGKAGKMVWACECAICGKVFKQSECEIDHIVEAGSLREIEDIQSFVEGLTLITFDDLQVVDKTCHKIKSHSARKGITFEEARKEKMVIEVMKDKNIKRILVADFGYAEEEVSNTGKRKRAVVNLIQSGRMK